jgi:hypothetical protein
MNQKTMKNPTCPRCTKRALTLGGDWKIGADGVTPQASFVCEGCGYRGSYEQDANDELVPVSKLPRYILIGLLILLGLVAVLVLAGSIWGSL